MLVSEQVDSTAREPSPMVLPENDAVQVASMITAGTSRVRASFLHLHREGAHRAILRPSPSECVSPAHSRLLKESQGKGGIPNWKHPHGLIQPVRMRGGFNFM